MGGKNGHPEPKSTLAIKVVPRAKKNEISQIMADGMVKIRLTAPPVEGKANKALIKLLAHELKIPAQDIKITSGGKSRNKTVLLKGIDERTAQSRIEKLIRGN